MSAEEEELGEGSEHGSESDKDSNEDDECEEPSCRQDAPAAMFVETRSSPL
jgi:hypothetical protein